jgi:hypothetical protein
MGRLSLPVSFPKLLNTFRLNSVLKYQKSLAEFKFCFRCYELREERRWSVATARIGTCMLLRRQVAGLDSIRRRTGHSNDLGRIYLQQLRNHKWPIFVRRPCSHAVASIHKRQCLSNIQVVGRQLHVGPHKIKYPCHTCHNKTVILKLKTLFQLHLYCGKWDGSRSQWPSGLRRRSTAVRILGLWIRITPGVWQSVSCECCVWSGTCLCDGMITRPEESYRVWCVWVRSWSLNNEEALAH